MKLKVKIRLFLLPCLGKIFYGSIYEALLFAFTLLLVRIIDVIYKVQDLNYLYVVILFLIGLALYKLFSKILYNKKLKLIFIILLIILLSIFALLRYKYIIEYLQTLLIYYSDIQDSFYYSKETFFYQYIPFFVVIIPTFVAVTLYLQSRGLGNIILVVSIIFLLNLWYAAELKEVKKYMLVYFIMVSFTYSYNKYINSIDKYKYENIKISVDLSKIFKYVITMALFIGIFSYAAVEVFGTKNAASLKAEWLAKSKILKEKSLSNRYDLSYSGFLNKDKKLGGPIKLNYDRALKVKTDKTYYLKGIVKDYYDGFKWSKTEDKYERNTEGYLRYPTANFRNYLQMNPPVADYMIIYPENLETSTLFSPSFTYSISLEKGNVGYDDSGSYTIIGASEIKDPYRVDFFKSKNDIGLFSNVHKNNVIIDYTAIGEGYFKDKYRKYLQIPDNVSLEIYNLVHDITKDCKTPTDKITAIESYLSKNYKYSLEVVEVPEGEEFISHFLFGEKKGYCTYFATAATVMLRIAGIPARYVEGFNMANKKDLDGLYEITNDMAHAWTEILLYPEEDIWSIVDCVTQAQWEEYVGSSGSRTRQGGLDSARSKNIITSINNKGSFFDLLSLGIILVWALFICLLIIIIYVITKIFLFYKMKEQVINSNSNIPLYNYVKNRLSYINIGGKIVEDDILWAKSINDSTLKVMVSLLISSAYEEFYGKKKVSEIDKLKIYNYIEGYMRLKQNKFRYYVNKMIRYKPIG